jgi:hypothetical protein
MVYYPTYFHTAQKIAPIKEGIIYHHKSLYISSQDCGGNPLEGKK